MIETPNIAALILAAGLSRRMGDANKLLLSHQGAPLVRKTAMTYLSVFSSCHLVLGYQADFVATIVRDLPLSLTFNPNYDAGRANSVLHGLTKFSKTLDHYQGVLIGLADQPLLTTNDLSALVTAFQENDGHNVIIPRFEENRGNPVIVPTDMIKDYLNTGADQPLKAFLAAHPERIRWLDVAHPRYTTDMDTPAEAALLGYR